MNKEEAISELEAYVMNNSNYDEEVAEAIRVVLAELEKQQADIEDCKKCVIRDDLHNYIEEFEKKDKIIDAMADALKFSFNSGINFFPSSICKCEGDIRKCEGKICTECIKEYFEKKVGE